MSRARLIKSAPLDGSDILVFHRIHGWMTAHYCPGEWHTDHEGTREYDGAIWCFGDDAFREEIEEISLNKSEWHHGPVTHWRPCPAKPRGTP